MIAVQLSICRSQFTFGKPVHVGHSAESSAPADVG
jgi:hypothetical protein